MAGRKTISARGTHRIATNVTLDPDLKDELVKLVGQRGLSQLFNELMAEWLEQRELEKGEEDTGE